MEIQWIKIAVSIFDDEKIKLIQAMPEGDTIFLIWVHLICLAGKCNSGGLVQLNDDTPYTAEMLATIFGKPNEVIWHALEVFERFGMIKNTENGIVLPNFQKHQNMDGLDKIKEQNRLRALQYRDRLREEKSNVTRNDKITRRHAIDKDKDVDKNIPQPPSAKGEQKVEFHKQERKEDRTPAEIIEQWDSPEDIKAEMKEFMKARAATRSAMTGHAVELAIGKLSELAGEDRRMAKKIIQQSIERGYKGLFPLKDGKTDSGSNTGRKYPIWN